MYTGEKGRLSATLQLLQKKHNRLGWLRLLTIGGTAIGAYQVFMAAGAWAWVVLLVGISLFLWVVSLDADNNRKLNFEKQLLQINEEELEILSGNFNHRANGSQWAPPVHDYASDLDLFGPFSMFQYVNRCASEQGRGLLAHNLLQPVPVETILQRQQAVNDWAPQMAWRQKLQATSALSPLTNNTQVRLEQWLQLEDASFTNPIWKWLVPVYTLIACGVAVAAIFDLIPGALFSALLFLFIIISFALGKKATATSAQLSGVVAELESMAGVLQCLEKPQYNSTLLQQLQESIRTNTGTASVQIRRLKALLNRFDLRLNVFLFIFLNAFSLWDVRQMMALHRWRAANKNAVAQWFTAIAHAEVLNSLATLRFNKPKWAQPRFTTPYFHFEATALGHPLLPEEQRVTSDFGLQGRGRIALITGSNMAGKSTFLRSLGVNVVLAQMGAVVCAGSMQLSPVNLLSSMRIADNLAENTSTFYAELKKLKVIIEAVRAKRPVLVLLDEILRGTNSLDRHTGSRALIQQLLREESVAVLATHDVELAQLEQQYPEGIENYHFDVQVSGEELYFDYKLKTGICSNLNASVLMRKIGIELDEQNA
jgi:hypothetical protein